MYILAILEQDTKHVTLFQLFFKLSCEKQMPAPRCQPRILITLKTFATSASGGCSKISSWPAPEQLRYQRQDAENSCAFRFPGRAKFSL